MKFILSFLASIILFVFFRTEVMADPTDSTSGKLQYPNNIKLNITSSIEFSPSIVVAYERTVKSHQSFSVMGGYVTFPVSLRDLPDSIRLVESKSSSGFRIGGDYRFYFKNENKYDAPHGLYWGPFFDYFYFKNKRTISVTDSSFATGTLDFTGELGIGQVGVQLGYQFVIKKRLSIDMTLFGPGLAYYGAKLKLDGDFNPNEENEYLQALYDFMINNLPLLGQLASEKEVKSNGRADLFFAGFRYSVCVGFRF